MIRDLLQIAGSSVPIRWRRNPKARRYILRVKSACLFATIPRGGSQREAWEFIERSQPWIERQLAKPAPAPRTHVWFRGERIPVDQFDPEFVQSIAAVELTRRTRELALQTGSEISRVTIRSQRTRWGSCSARRTISLNWRLIQTPAFVVDYIILHELMHLRQMNHSAKFWREVESVCPGWREAEAWLKKNGRDVLSS